MYITKSIDPSQELTSEKWRYRVVSSSVNLTVDENGEPVVPSGTAGVSYADGVLTIYPRFVVHFGVNDIVNCDIVNEGKLDGGIFTGTVTNKGVIESGMFVNKPENANDRLCRHRHPGRMAPGRSCTALNLQKSTFPYLHCK